jgi:hypothetical protein
MIKLKQIKQYKSENNPFSPVQFKQQTREEEGGKNFKSSFKSGRGRQRWRRQELEMVDGDKRGNKRGRRQQF